MPSILSKLSSKRNNNPYLNAQHPSHAPAAPNRSSKPPLRTVSPTPSQNLLAEARQAVNRDPVTGRLLPTPPPSQDFLAEARQNLNRDPTTGRPLHPSPHSPDDDSKTWIHDAVEKLGWRSERTAYMDHAERKGTKIGNRYDIVAAEGRRKAEEEERVGRARGGLEYYAPERRVEEFYAGGVKD